MVLYEEVVQAGTVFVALHRVARPSL
jgi:hypothetical protein